MIAHSKHLSLRIALMTNYIQRFNGAPSIVNPTDISFAELKIILPFLPHRWW